MRIMGARNAKPKELISVKHQLVVQTSDSAVQFVALELNSVFRSIVVYLETVMNFTSTD